MHFNTIRDGWFEPIHFSLHWPNSAGGVPVANGAPRRGYAAPRQLGSSAARQLGSSAARQLARRFFVLLVTSSSRVVSRSSSRPRSCNNTGHSSCFVGDSDRGVSRLAPRALEPRLRSSRAWPNRLLAGRAGKRLISRRQTSRQAARRPHNKAPLYAARPAEITFSAPAPLPLLLSPAGPA